MRGLKVLNDNKNVLSKAKADLKKIEEYNVQEEKAIAKDISYCFLIILN
jgi:hypothetical protein